MGGGGEGVCDVFSCTPRIQALDRVRVFLCPIDQFQGLEETVNPQQDLFTSMRPGHRGSESPATIFVHFFLLGPTEAVSSGSPKAGSQSSSQRLEYNIDTKGMSQSPSAFPAAASILAPGTAKSRERPALWGHFPAGTTPA